jgi:phage-related protein
MPLSSIYNVSAYNSSVTYALNDICIYNSKYYYSLKWSNTSNPTVATAWGGYKSFSTPYGAAVSGPEFIWIPNYASDIENKPSVITIKFGDGYEQRIPDGVNNSLIKLNLIFEGRSEREMKAIVHFLNVRKGIEPFFFNYSFPYNYDSVSQNYPKRFMVDEFTSRSVFYDNYTVNAKLSETVNI